MEMLIVVIGGGIIGLASAWSIARSGGRVTIVEAGVAAREASWAAAGMLAPGGEFSRSSPLAEMAMESLRQYPAFVDELKRESGFPIDLRMCGAIDLAEDAELRSAGQRAAGILSEACSFRGHAARYYPEDSLVNPRHLARALIEVCRRVGVTIEEHSAVLSIEDGGQAVRTADRSYLCDRVLVAAGAWSSRLYPGLPESIPVRGHLIGWRDEAAPPHPILRGGNTYIVWRNDGQVVAGSSTEHAGFDRTVDPAVVEEIKVRVAVLLPEAPVKDAIAWNGLRPFVSDETPVIGRIPATNIYTAYGHYRNGILLAPETARRVSALMHSA